MSELWQYRELFYLLAGRDVKLRYKQTLLGVLWVLIQPLSTMLVFTVLFGKVAGLPSNGAPYPIFYLSALLPWTYFSTTLGLVSNSLIGNANLLTKVYFPRIVLPAATGLAGLLDLAIGSLSMLAALAYYRVPPTWFLLLWPVLVLPLFVLTLGLGMVFASLNVRYRDIKYAIPFGVQLLLFLTPIIYPASSVRGRLGVLLQFNPLTGLIEAFRFSLFPQNPLNWSALLISLAMTVGLFLVGLWYFRSTERSFADIV